MLLLGIKPFHLHRNDYALHLCPVRAYMYWYALRENKIGGPLFLRIDHNGRIDHERQLRYPAFKLQFEADLRSIGYSKWYLYGTHSFRRGGCQYWHHYANPRWTLRQLCAWGGWSLEFDNMTIVRYLMGENDGSDELRENYTKPIRPHGSHL